MAGMKVNVPSKKVNNSILAASRCTLVFCTLPLTGATGVLSSPNYPDDYPDNDGAITKQWIQVEEGLVVSLQVTAFEIEFQESTNGYKGCGDYLIIEDYDSGDDLMDGCGNPSDDILNYDSGTDEYVSIGTNLPTFTSIGNIVLLKFTTDGLTHNGPKTGWSVQWTAVAPGECQPSLGVERLLCLFLILSFFLEEVLENWVRLFLRNPKNATTCIFDAVLVIGNRSPLHY